MLTTMVSQKENKALFLKVSSRENFALCTKAMGEIHARNAAIIMIRFLFCNFELTEKIKFMLPKKLK